MTHAGRADTGARDLAMHQTLRSARGTLGTLGFALLLALSSHFAPVQALLRVHPSTLWTASLTAGCITVLAGVAFRLHGRGHPVYGFLHRLETFNFMAWVMYLVWVSGTAVSFAWPLYFAVIGQSAATGSYRRFNTVVILGLPLCLAAAFVWWRADPGNAVLSVLAGIMGGVMYGMVGSSWVLLTQARADQERLAQRLQDLLVQQERERIARDLHDGVGSELSGLLWRARVLHDQLEGEPLKAELATFMDRVRVGTDELRSVVWALRSPDQRWGDLVCHLRGRCTELCEETVDLSLEDRGADPDWILPGDLRLQVTRLVQEAVRNAVRHAHPRHVRVVLDGRGPVRIMVQDDGSGMPQGVWSTSCGGLRNIQQRLKELGGLLQVESGPQGTRLFMEIPPPQEVMARSA